MTIVSHAQNFEDVILWRALKHIEHGFYIDVGAQDPEFDSVSLAFYEHGWRGVHVEPSADYAKKLRQARPDENVINAAVGKEDGEIAFFEVAGTGLSTGDEEIAKNAEAEGRPVTRRAVACQRFASVLDTYKDRDIHWLKIDVEGMEADVIDGWLPSRVRPWIVVVESTLPNSTIPSHQAWEPGLSALGYEFAYFDGLNRFYVSVEHPELKERVGPGPNFFDDFVLSKTSKFGAALVAEIDLQRERWVIERDARLWTEERLTAERMARVESEARLTQQLAAERAQLTHQLAAERSRSKAAEDQIAAMLASSSWRVTAPLRASNRALSWLANGTKAWATLRPGSRPRRVTRHAVMMAARFVLVRPALARATKSVLRLSPRLAGRFRLMLAAPPTSARTMLDTAADPAVLSPRARRIYRDIKTAIARR